MARFAVGKFEVTFDEWAECVALGGCPDVPDSGWGKSRRPAINLSWDEAKQYVAWLSSLTGKDYRLLTEAEWEYAARAGTSTAYSFGSTPRKICSHANLADISLKKGQPSYPAVDYCDDRFDGTAPVGAYPPNALGLHDMHGNVWEWTEDCYGRNFENARPEKATGEAAGCNFRVCRGGSWADMPQYLRLAVRLKNRPEIRYNYVGFRVSRTLNR